MTAAGAARAVSSAGVRVLLVPLALLVLLALSPVSPAVAAAGAGDPDLGRQYGLAQIGAPDAWRATKGGGVVVAVVDTGVDAGHEDLSANLLPAYNASRRSTSGTQDDSGHGTHVAGIAAAVLGNGRGGAGVAPASKVLPIKVFDGGPLESTTEIAVAVRYALSKGARVINLSIASLYPDLPVSDLEGPCNDAFVNGALCVIAAGNRGEGSASGFSRGVDAMVVTAHDSRGTHASFASRADTKWALSAPGVAVHSTLPGGAYGMKQGTSMAAPHVAGVAALLFSKGLTAWQVAERLVATAVPTINPGVDGAGRLDAAAAVGVARSSGSAGGAGAPAPVPAQEEASAPAPAASPASAPSGPAASVAGAASTVRDGETSAPPVAGDASPTAGDPPVASGSASAVAPSAGDDGTGGGPGPIRPGPAERRFPAAVVAALLLVVVTINVARCRGTLRRSTS